MTPSTLAIAGRVAAKELRTLLRDRAALVYTVVLPFVLYPAIFWIMLQGFTILQGRDEATEVTVAVSGEPTAVARKDLAAALHGVEEGADGAREVVRVVLLETPIDDAEARRMLSAEHAAGEDDPVHAILRFEETGEAEPNLYFDSTRSLSSLAEERVRSRLATLTEDTRSQAVRDAGENPNHLAPFHLERVDVASERDRGGFILSLLLPMMFVVMAVMGAFYPAVDVTAGEKERGTAETTLLAPVPRLGVQLGKILAVTASALIATVLNLVGMGLAAEHLFAALFQRMDAGFEIPWSDFPLVAPFCLLFLFMTSAILVAASSLTKTFKQGQSQVGLLQLLFLLPAMVAVMPGIHLTTTLALVPVVQTVLAFKAMLQPALQDEPSRALQLVLVVVSQCLYAWIAIRLSVKLGTRESLLTGEAKLGQILGIFRSEGAPR